MLRQASASASAFCTCLLGCDVANDRVLNLLFAAFALAYAGTLLLGVVWRNAATIDDYIAINRWDVLFVVPAYIALTWYVALYWRKTPGSFRLRLVTLVLTTFGVVYYFRPNNGVLSAVTAQQVTLPGVNDYAVSRRRHNLDDAVFIEPTHRARVHRCGMDAAIPAWRPPRSIVLGLGVVWFCHHVDAGTARETGIIAYVPFGEIGFFGIAVAVTLQMADSILRTEVARQLSDKSGNARCRSYI